MPQSCYHIGFKFLTQVHLCFGLVCVEFVVDNLGTSAYGS